ncbi:hypothetical protein [Salmonella phage D1-2]|uniref:Uncharacterized protein n=1 Tax=Salmonella phage D1-2 TaxID=2614123 RepID=A0A5Q2F323_9CAUD|nr:hypothetical protein [Salmonella phage D1-2]
MYLSNLKRSAAMSVLRLSFEERQEFIDTTNMTLLTLIT